MSMFKIVIEDSKEESLFEYYCGSKFKSTNQTPVTVENFFELVLKENILFNDCNEQIDNYFYITFIFKDWSQKLNFKIHYDGNQIYFDRKFLMICEEPLDILIVE